MKKYLLGLFALVLAVGFTAFTAKKVSAKRTAVDWVLKSGVDATDGDARIVPSNYERPSGGSLTCTSGSNVECKIIADDADNNGQPDIPNPSQFRTDLYNSDLPVPVATSAIVLKP